MGLISQELGSAIVGGIQLVFAALIWLAVVKPGTQMSRRTSIPTAIGLWLLGGIFVAMGPLWVAAACSSLAALGWTAMAILRPELTPDVAASRVRKYHRKWRKEKMRKRNAYHERNQVVAAYAWQCLRLGYRVGIAKTDIPGWDKDQHNCVYIDLPTGQLSWHFRDREKKLFEGLPTYEGTWDGHETPEKYRRLQAAFKVPA